MYLLQEFLEYQQHRRFQLLLEMLLLLLLLYLVHLADHLKD